MKRKCKVCGNEFIVHKEHKNQHICSDKCRHINNYVPSLEKYFGLDKTTIGSKIIFDEIERIKKELDYKYNILQKSSSEIAKEYDYPSYCNLTGKIFNYLGITSRSCKEEQHRSFKTGRKQPSNKTYQQGWYTTWNNKNVYLHSSYEFDFAKILDGRQIDYNVEDLRIEYFDTQRNEYRIAIPDFHLLESNTIVEVKSNFTLDKQNLLDKFLEYRKYGYETKLWLEHTFVNIG